MKKKRNNPPKTVLTIVVGFTVIYMITKLEWTIILASSIGIFSLSSNQISKWIDLLWEKITWILSLIVPNIILSLFFYLLLFPISILARLFRKKDPLILKNRTNSLFISINKKIKKEDFEKMW